MNEAKVSILKHSPIFSGLDHEELAELAGLAVERALRPGDTVFWEGDAPDWFYLVADGRIKVSKTSSLGREFIIAFFAPNEMFGEVAVFENRPYPASAQAATESRVLAIARKDFLGFLAGRPDVALRVIGVLGGRLRDAQGRLRDLAGERVEQRVARTLLMLSSKLGAELPFTRREIADMAGTTPETAIRVMSRLQDGRIVRSTRGKTVILDLTRPRLLSDGPPQV